MELYNLFQFFLITSLIGFAVTAIFYILVAKIIVDHKRAEQIASFIRIGAMTFLKKEYTVLSSVIVVAFALLFYVAGMAAAWSYVVGAVSSMVAGYIGMRAATMANVRTTLAAKAKGEREAFLVALSGGAVMGFVVASLGLLGLGTLFYYFIKVANFEQLLVCYGLGASSIALFARVGGGIYTKSADVGADLVGKIELGIPEDDPRNPAVIADNVGDCVGDTAGMGADIFESYVGSAIAAIQLAFIMYSGEMLYVSLPIVLFAIGLIGSLVGLLSAFVLKTQVSTLLNIASYVSMAAFFVGSYAYIAYAQIPMNLFGAVVVGGLVGVAIGLITNYYTSSTPIKNLAKASESGAGTNLIYGLSIGFESTFAPIIMIAGAIFVAYHYCGGMFGVALTGVAMLATTAIIMTIDAYGPIADNAGGISEMSGFGPDVRKITDKLDALGNVTAALGKGFAIGSAALTALALFAAYTKIANIRVLDLTDPAVVIGLFLGGAFPFLISSMTMRSVGKAAWKMVEEVRRQFKEIPGLSEGKADPDYERCIEISTTAALWEMMPIGIITIVAPIAVRYIFGSSGHLALGGFLAGGTLTGVLLALTMANGGGAWDNAKKYIEAGNFGGKGSPAHKAAVVGDTVGDPFKDTSGPSLNIFMKLMSVLALFLATL